MSDLFSATYNPDVLSCLANLSNDEVFTPPEVVNQMLDMLPKEIWSDKNATFLDPACKSGVFLREIAKRLIEAQLPNYEQISYEINEKLRAGGELDGRDIAFQNMLEDVIEHVFKNQVFGIAITELTSLLSRRSVYCSKYPQSEYSVVRFDNPEGRIDYKQMQHTWKNGKCAYCGASEGEYDREEGKEQYAYEFIHLDNPEEVFDMKFDVIIGNPPYQLSDGGNSASAMPIYHTFIQQAKKLNPRYLAMITPSRWFVGGRGLNAFRSEMLNDDRLRAIHDYPHASDCFPGVEIKGGVSYFLWDRDHAGLCEIHTHENEKEKIDTRPLLEDGLDVFIRTSDQLSILNKTRNGTEEFLYNAIAAGRHFGFHTQIKWDGPKGTLQTADGQSTFPITKDSTDQNSVMVYVANGTCWISPNNIIRNKGDINKWKVLIPRSGNPSGSILGKPKLSEPGTCSSNTYNVVVCSSEQEARNLISYLKTKFVRFLVSIRTVTQDMAPKAFEFVPIQDFSKTWTDEELFKKYSLDSDEISAIESSIPEMD